MYQEKLNNRGAGIVTLISNKVKCKPKTIKCKKGEHCLILKPKSQWTYNKITQHSSLLSKNSDARGYRAKLTGDFSTSLTEQVD